MASGRQRRSTEKLAWEIFRRNSPGKSPIMENRQRAGGGGPVTPVNCVGSDRMGNVRFLEERIASDAWYDHTPAVLRSKCPSSGGAGLHGRGAATAGRRSGRAGDHGDAREGGCLPAVAAEWGGGVVDGARAGDHRAGRDGLAPIGASHTRPTRPSPGRSATSSVFSRRRGGFPRLRTPITRRRLRSWPSRRRTPTAGTIA